MSTTSRQHSRAVPTFTDAPGSTLHYANELGMSRMRERVYHEEWLSRMYVPHIVTRFFYTEDDQVIAETTTEWNR